MRTNRCEEWVVLSNGAKLTIQKKADGSERIVVTRHDGSVAADSDLGDDIDHVFGVDDDDVLRGKDGVGVVRHYRVAHVVRYGEWWKRGTGQ